MKRLSLNHEINKKEIVDLKDLILNTPFIVRIKKCNALKLKIVKFKRLMLNVLLLLPIISLSCVTTTQDNNVSNEYPELKLIRLEPDRIQQGGSFTIHYQYKSSGPVDIKLEVILKDHNMVCEVFDAIIHQPGAGQGDRSVNVSSSNFSISSCNFVNSLNNKSYDVKLYSSIASGNSTNLVIGTNNFNVRYYNPRECLSNGWANLENVFQTDCKTTLNHITNANGQLPCVTLDGLQNLTNYLVMNNNITQFANHTYDNSCYLIGLCTVTGFPVDVYAYTEFRATGSGLSQRIPARSFIFSENINNLLESNGWTNERKNLARQYLTAHELGHARGYILHSPGGENHDDRFGSKWQTCCMHSPVSYNYAGFRNDLDYCSNHSNSITLNWW